MEVQELRHQVRMLSAELQQLRTNLSGSTQSLQVHCSDGQNASVSNLSASGRVSWTSASVGLSPNNNSRNFMAEDFKPPLPPRLYRPPVKPQRTFAQNGNTSMGNVQNVSNWMKIGMSFDCLPTISNNEGPILPPRNFHGNRTVSKPPPPPPPKSYNKRPTTIHLENSNLPTNNFSPTIQNSSFHNNVSKNISIQSKSNAIHQLSSSINGDYSEVCKTGATNFVRNSCCTDNRLVNKNLTNCNKIKNLSHFGEPLTEANFVHSLSVGFTEGFNWYQVGPVLLYLNPFNHTSSQPMSFSSNEHVEKPIINLINDVHSHFHDSDVSQAVVISGERGSGKTHVTMQILTQIFHSFGSKGTYQNDSYRNFCATVDVLKSLTTVRRSTSAFSNQAAFLYELHIADGLVAKAKIHCCFLDESRLCGKTQGERNFQIFYQILSGLSFDERKKFHLNNYAMKTLNYLNGAFCQNSIDVQNLENDKNQFHIWKSSLAILGIAFSDVMRVLSAVLLLGNVKFVESKEGVELDIDSGKDLEAVAALLGITSSTLCKSLTKYSTYIKRQWVKTSRSVQAVYDVRDSLAKTLYHRCICAIIRRANSLKTSVRPGSGISSSDESCAHDSGIGMTSQTSEGTINSSQNSSQGADGLISVFDSFGFDDLQHNYFERLCANYASEKLQSFYRTKLFRSNQQLLRDEGIENEYDLDVFNAHLPSDDVLELFLSPKTGVFYLLDEECASPSGSSSHFHQMLKQYNKNTKQLEFLNDSATGGQQPLNNFTVKHYSSTPTTYNASDFVAINRDLLSSDVIKMFNSNACNFGFVSHLFAHELRLDERQQNQVSYRISPSSNTDFSARKSSTFCQDFTFQMDTFIKSLTSCKSHFVQCIKTNSKGECGKLDENDIGRQIVRLDLLPLVRLLSTGLPYFVKLKEFNCRYKFLIIKYHGAFLAKAPSVVEETKVLLDCYLKAVDESNLPYVSNHWSLCSQYIFLSEGAHEQLEALRQEHRTKAAITLQKFIRKWLKKQRGSFKVNSWNVSNGRPRPLIGSTVGNSSIPAYHLVEKFASQQGLNLTDVPPPLPACRKYSIKGEQKTPFPQRRIMTDSFVDCNSKIKLNVGDIVTAIGWSVQQKRLIIREPNGGMVFVPFASTKLSIQ